MLREIVWVEVEANRKIIDGVLCSVGDFPVSFSLPSPSLSLFLSLSLVRYSVHGFWKFVCVFVEFTRWLIRSRRRRRRRRLVNRRLFIYFERSWKLHRRAIDFLVCGQLSCSFYAVQWGESSTTTTMKSQNTSQ